ncbi:MAG: hypothetical protein RLZZ383_1190 [Pseudomonadota bacterium]|jgi:uncharacterized membrane protein YfcA
MSPLVFALSLLVGLALGMLGGGGSILTLPILKYAAGVPDKEAIAASLVVVGLTSAAAVVSHARQGNVDVRIGGIFAAAGALGAYVGGVLAAFVPGTWLVRGFLLMMAGTGVAMLRGRGEAVAAPTASLPVVKIAVEGLVVGIVTGLVGAGGGFLVVPALTLLGGLDMRKAVGTSLLVIAIKSFTGYLGHASHEAVDMRLALMVAGGAIVGSFLGGWLAPRVPAERLRQAFGVFVLGMAVWMGWQEWVA